MAEPGGGGGAEPSRKLFEAKFEFLNSGRFMVWQWSCNNNEICHESQELNQDKKGVCETCTTMATPIVPVPPAMTPIALTLASTRSVDQTSHTHGVCCVCKPRQPFKSGVCMAMKIPI